MSEFKFSSKVRKEYYDSLEKLFFFNEEQNLYYEKIIEVVEKYGEPYIAKYGDYITIELEKVDTECLFASYGPKLVGVMVYKINKLSKSISVIHIALDVNFTMRGKQAKKMLAINMIDKLKDIYYKRDEANYIKVEYIKSK